MIFKVKWLVTGGEAREESFTKLDSCKDFLEELSKKARQLGAYFDVSPYVVSIGNGEKEAKVEREPEVVKKKANGKKTKK